MQLEQKYMAENFLSDPGERSAFFVVSWIKVYIIIIMGHQFFDNRREIFLELNPLTLEDFMAYRRRRRRGRFRRRRIRSVFRRRGGIRM